MFLYEKKRAKPLYVFPLYSVFIFPPIFFYRDSQRMEPSQVLTYSLNAHINPSRNAADKKCFGVHFRPFVLRFEPAVSRINLFDHLRMLFRIRNNHGLSNHNTGIIAHQKKISIGKHYSRLPSVLGMELPPVGQHIYL